MDSGEDGTVIDALDVERERAEQLKAQKATVEKVTERTLDSLRSDNNTLEKEIRALEKAKKEEITSLKNNLEDLGRQKADAENRAEKEI
ncbi:MAG TPA: hypothetical protein PLD93_06595, partial [Synergistaceae bacterium]|nr:hypothetical protein [Synergistaceae bacterium]